MKKFLSLILCIVLLAVCVPLGAFTLGVSAETESYYTYTVADGKATITDCGTDLSGDITIPSTLGGYPVTAIGLHAFFCQGFENVTIPDGVTSIGICAFTKCTSLVSITIPDSVIAIGESVFSGCSSLASVVIGNHVTSIGDWAFSSCSSLENITVSDSVISIGRYAFENTAWYDNQPDGVVYAGKVAYAYKGTCPSKVVLKDGTRGIAAAAFSFCDSLTEIDIPYGVLAIGESAFCYCSNLVTVHIPNSIISVISSAFMGTAWYSNQPDGVVYIGKVAYSYHGSGSGVLTIKEGTVSISDWAFTECTKFTDVILPNSLKIINSGAFSVCSALENVNIPDGVTEIGDYAFDYCSSLTKVVIPNSVTSMGIYAFDSCTSLESVSIGEGLSTIDNCSFYDCTALTNVTLSGNVEAINVRAFHNCTALQTVHYTGTAADWDLISIHEVGNTDLTAATRHYMTLQSHTATCLQDGAATYSCAECEQTYTGRIARQPKAHTFSGGGCTVCGIAQALAPCDLDGDCKADANDVIEIRSRLLSGSAVCDVNNDGESDIRDLVRMKKLLAG